MAQKLLTKYLIIFVALFFFNSALAQFDSAEDSRENNEVEQLYDKFEKEEQQTTQRRRPKPKRRAKEPDPSSLSELATLAPFEDIAVIQKRFLPKTGRFEFSGSLMGTINNPFFLNVGAGLRVGYYFTEKLGIEGMYFWLSSSEKEVTKNLKSKQNVRTQSIVSPENYIGVDFKYTPVYGKMTLMNKTIVPFDLYFAVGGGTTGTEQGRNEPTIHLGTGQIFALSKRFAFRWDFSWNFYQAESEVLVNNVLQTQKSTNDDLYISFGLSFFWPEATYR